MARKFKLKRRPGRVPSPPLNAQVNYLRKIREVLGYARALVDARLQPRIDRWLAERADARTPQSKQVATVVGQIREALNRKFTNARLEDIAEGVSEEVSAHQRAQMTAQVGIELPAKADRGLGKLIDAFTHENAALIRSVPVQYLDGVQSAVLAGLSSGMRHEQLSKVLVAKHGVAENRAALIARDQVSKFNGRLTKERQTNLGIVSYIWHTVHDQRVRDAHAERDGETYDWSDPPGDLTDPADGGHPGEPINCRCFAEGLLPDLEDDAPDNAEPPDDSPDPLSTSLEPSPPPWDPASPLHEEWIASRGGRTEGG